MAGKKRNDPTSSKSPLANELVLAGGVKWQTRMVDSANRKLVCIFYSFVLIKKKNKHKRCNKEKRQSPFAATDLHLFSGTTGMWTVGSQRLTAQ